VASLRIASLTIASFGRPSRVRRVQGKMKLSEIPKEQREEALRRAQARRAAAQNRGPGMPWASLLADLEAQFIELKGEPALQELYEREKINGSKLVADMNKIAVLSREIAVAEAVQMITPHLNPGATVTPAPSRLTTRLQDTPTQRPPALQSNLSQLTPWKTRETQIAALREQILASKDPREQNRLAKQVKAVQAEAEQPPAPSADWQAQVDSLRSLLMSEKDPREKSRLCGRIKVLTEVNKGLKR